MTFLSTQQLIDIAIWLFALPAGWLVGKVLKTLALPRLRRASERTANELDDLIVSLLDKVIVPICWIGGVVSAYQTSHLHDAYRVEIKEAISIFSILILTWVSAQLVTAIANFQIHRLGKDVAKSSIFTKILKVIVYILGIMGCLQVLGISIAPMLTALGVGGLAVALALQDTLSNLFAGIQLIAGRKIKPGDYVQLATGEEGHVEDISWRNTIIRALSNHLIIVPNSKISSSIVRNFILPDSQIAVSIDVGVAYTSDLDHVERVCIEVGREIMLHTEGGVKDHEPLVRFKLFGESSITVRTILRAEEFTGQFLIQSEFIRKLHKRFQEENIEIPFPIRTLHIKKDPS